MIVANEIKTLISENLDIDQSEIKILIPKFDKYGYVSVNFHNLIDITSLNKQEIKEKLKLILNVDYIDKIEFINDYCNIFLNRGKYIEYFDRRYTDEYIDNSINIGKREKVLLEHTSTTPDASPHLGRSRGTIIGDFLKNILSQTHFNVKTEYFVNDLAKQVSMIVSVYDFNKRYDLKQISELYVQSYNECLNNVEKEMLVDYQIKECQDGNPEYQEKFAIVTNNCINEQNNIFEDFQVYFDEYIFESEILNEKKDQLLKKLKDRKILGGDFKGCLYIPVKKDGKFSKNTFLTRENGSSLYLFRDLCYSLKKHDGKYNKSIVVVPAYQNEHMTDVNYILREIGLPQDTVIYYESVYKDGQKMSTKNSCGVLLEDLIIDLRKYLLEVDTNLSRDIVKFVTNKTIRKYILNIKPDKKLNYNYSEIKKLCYSELKKTLFLEKLKEEFTDKKYSKVDNINFELLKKLDMLDDIIKSSTKSLSAQPLIKYEEDLFKTFFESYEQGTLHRILIEKYILVAEILNKLIIGNKTERSNFEYESSHVYTHKIK